MRRIATAVSASLLAIGALAPGSGCSDGPFTLGTDANVPDASSGGSNSGSSSGAANTSGTVDSGAGTGVQGSGSSGTPSAGSASGWPASGSSSGSAVDSGPPPHCTPGLDQTCNEELVMNALAGVCKANGTCTCNSGFAKAPSGKCGPPCGAAACSSGSVCCYLADRCCNPIPSCLAGGSVCPRIGIVCTAAAGCPPPPIDAGTSTLRWYRTCGNAVCAGGAGPACGTSALSACFFDDAGAPCPPLGSSCSVKGATCGQPSASNCGATQVCDDHDPTGGPGGCPVSSAKFKNDVRYLDENQLEELHDETMQVRLATYNYKGQYGDPDLKHLGFIIEDRPESFAVDRGHDRVDLYGYLSVVVAAMQVQEKEIADLRRQLDESRAGACGPVTR